jgi:hypothetical protein
MKKTKMSTIDLLIDQVLATLKTSSQDISTKNLFQPTTLTAIQPKIHSFLRSKLEKKSMSTSIKAMKMKSKKAKYRMFLLE